MIKIGLRSVAILFCLVSNLVAEEMPLQGKWVFSTVEAFDGVIGADPAIASRDYLGKIIEYRSGWIRFEDVDFPVTAHRNEYWTSDDLYRETRGSTSAGLNFQMIDYKGGLLKIVTLAARNFRNPGYFLFILSPNRMLTLYNGVYYRLDRLNLTKPLK